jgi:hypothetical protein
VREEREKAGKGAEGDSHRAGRPMSLRGEGGGGEALSPSISLSWWPRLPTSSPTTPPVVSILTATLPVSVILLLPHPR